MAKTIFKMKNKFGGIAVDLLYKASVNKQCGFGRGIDTKLSETR